MSQPLSELGYDSEFAVVGCLMVHSGKVQIPYGMTPEWFGNWVARTIFEAIKRVVSTGAEADPVLVRNNLVEHGQLEKIGGDDMLVEIMEAHCVPSALGWVSGTLKTSMVRRRVREVALWLSKTADNPDFDLGDLSARLLEAASIASGSDSCPVFSIGDIDHGGEDIGVTTGFSGLDAYMSTGGYAAGQSNIVSAYHKGGKTTFMLSSAVRQLQAGKSVLWATFADLNSAQIKRRILKNLCGWSRSPNRIDLLQDYDEALSWLNRQRLDVYDASALDSGYDIETFRGWFIANHDRRGYDCVFVDYAQKLRTSKRLSPFDAANHCSEMICRMAARTSLPFVVGSQITPGNEVDGRKDITKGSRAWEEDAGWVLRLKRDGDRVDVSIPYSRFGPDGETSLKWNGERLRMETQ